MGPPWHLVMINTWHLGPKATQEATKRMAVVSLLGMVWASWSSWHLTTSGTSYCLHVLKASIRTAMDQGGYTPNRINRSHFLQIHNYDAFGTTVPETPRWPPHCVGCDGHGVPLLSRAISRANLGVETDAEEFRNWYPMWTPFCLRTKDVMWTPFCSPLESLEHLHLPSLGPPSDHPCQSKSCWIQSETLKNHRSHVACIHVIQMKLLQWLIDDLCNQKTGSGFETQIDKFWVLGYPEMLQCETLCKKTCK